MSNPSHRALHIDNEPLNLEICTQAIVFTCRLVQRAGRPNSGPNVKKARENQGIYGTSQSQLMPVTSGDV